MPPDNKPDFFLEITPEIYDAVVSKSSNKYSQFGEDGIIKELTRRIGVTNKWCLEVGAADGLFCSNTRQFVEEGWKAVLIEKDFDEFCKLMDNATESCICKNIEIEPNGRHSIDNILSGLDAPYDIELMSLDLDGGEYHIWNSMLKVRPKIIVVEHSRNTTDAEYVPKFGKRESAGYKALIKLGTAKGYTLFEIVGHNLIFVDKRFFKVDDNKGTKGKKMVTQTEKIKLNLGAGDTVIDGFVAIDRKDGQEVYPLDFEDNSIDEIRASHILEHFDYADREHLKVLADWYRALKPGGVMKIAVPDARKICQEYIDGKKINIVGYLLGGHTDDNDYHKIIYDEQSLKKGMESVGLIGIDTWESEVSDCASLPISLNLMGYKPNGSEVKPFNVANVQPKEDENSHIVTGKLDCSKIGAVMSMPRLTFTDNMFCAVQTFGRLGINIRQGVGVFWGQILTRSMEEVMSEGKEFIVTIDYDTYFTKEQFLYLYYMITTNPDIDAILPVQIKREGECALAGLVPSRELDGDEDHPVMDSSRFAEPLTQIVTGHFGLTIIRAKALKALSKPWFLGVPNKDGDWGKNRLDDDIYFWNHMHEENKKVFMANYCKIGHMQLMCTYPDTLENGWKPIHSYITDIRKTGLPDHCVPKLTLGKG